MPSLLFGPHNSPCLVLNDSNLNINKETACRKRKRSDSPPPLKLTRALKSTGRHIGRYVSLTADIQNTLMQMHPATELTNEDDSDEDNDEDTLKPYQYVFVHNCSIFDIIVSEQRSGKPSSTRSILCTTKRYPTWILI